MSPEQLRCLELAERAIGLSEPNPRVGCVIRTTQGQEVHGHTHAAGGPHAEAHALQQAQARGLDLRGATVWVSLEPCSHHGRTPPCSSALVKAGVARVEVACLDPNPLVRGRGVAELQQAGIEVQLDQGTWMAQARALNIGFMSRMERGRPWVRMKVAASLDGTTALHNGRSQWITAPAARADGHRWRARAGAILTGIGTVRDDNPRLDVRAVEVAQQPLRVVIDSRLDMPPSARVLQPPGRCLVYSLATDPERLRAFSGMAGVEVCRVGTSPSPDGGASTAAPPAAKNDLAAVLADLGQRGINELHVEAGEKLNGSLLREGLVDEVLVYLAPSLLGPGRRLAEVFARPLESLDQGLHLQFVDCTMVGPDLRLRALTAQGQRAWAQAWPAAAADQGHTPALSVPAYPA